MKKPKAKYKNEIYAAVFFELFDMNRFIILALLRPASTSTNSLVRIGSGMVACPSIEKKRFYWLSLLLVAKKLNLIRAFASEHWLSARISSCA